MRISSANRENFTSNQPFSKDVFGSLSIDLEPLLTEPPLKMTVLLAGRIGSIFTPRGEMGHKKTWLHMPDNKEKSGREAIRPSLESSSVEPSFPWRCHLQTWCRKLIVFVMITERNKQKKARPNDPAFWLIKKLLLLNPDSAFFFRSVSSLPVRPEAHRA